MANTSVTALRFRPKSRTKPLSQAEARDRWLVHRVELAWGFLVLNVLAFAPHASLLPIPSTLGKVITQGALPFALLLALTANRRITIRPSVFLCLVSLLALEAILTALFSQYPKGTGYRTFRYAEFVAVLWVLSAFWDRDDMLLVRAHLKTLLIVMASVIIGFAISPGRALGSGRLAGIIWPIPGTQLAHYSAVVIGITLMMWFCGQMSRNKTIIIVVSSFSILLLTHTRTALVAMIGGVIVGGLSLISASTRVRKVFIGATAVVAVVLTTSSGAITSWLARGQGQKQLMNLSGRTNFWGPLLAYPRNLFQEIFGFGLSNGTFGGLPIDSNWLDSYESQGLFGCIICGLILLFLYVAAAQKERGLKRAIALFLITYCLIASFTEDGFTDTTPYMLDVMLAASLLVPFRITNNQ